jgi:cyclophilin family peptidyl-prolyl cis-trans isomerase
LLPASENQAALNWLRKVRNDLQNTAPEAEIAYARIWPAAYLAEFGEGEIAVKNLQRTFILNWRSGAAIASGLGEIASVPNSVNQADELKHWAEELLAGMVNYRNSGIRINSLLPLHTEYGMPEVLRAYAAFKPKDLKTVLLDNLKDNDVIVRATVADLLGDLPPSEENTKALVDALGRARNDKVNDAVLSTLDSLAKQKTAAANQTIKSSLNSPDYLVRRRAATLLKENGAGDFRAKVGPVRSRNTLADYQRALSRIGKPLQVAVTTTKGSFTIDLLPTEAPLTVDNFVQLAQRGYFNGVTIHRVVPNFVIQDGDPRGDGTGGPGYEIRCEINQRLFDRAVVGMALSGKDTGGSQWFVTHSPQPHLDGGYTVFGQVSSGMEVVDKIVRGDLIMSIQLSPKITRRE